MGHLFINSSLIDVNMLVESENACVQEVVSILDKLDLLWFEFMIIFVSLIQSKRDESLINWIILGLKYTL